MDIKRLHILLCCNLGASTGVMVTKMREIAANSKSLADTDLKIDARPAGDLKEYIADYDVVLLGPQIKHQFESLKKICEEFQKPIGIIDMKDYGFVNGANILKQAIVLTLNHKA